LADNTVFPKTLGDCENQISGSCPLEHRTGQPESEHWRNQHGNRLPEHRGLRLDPTHTPSNDSQPIHHGRMRIGPDESVWIGECSRWPLDRHHYTRELSEADLVHNPRVGRYDFEIVKGVLAPPQKCVALFVARELEFGVELEGIRLRKVVNLYRVVHNELDGFEGVDAAGVAAQSNNAIAHSSEVHDRRNTREILEQNPRRHEGDLPCFSAADVPSRQRLDV